MSMVMVVVEVYQEVTLDEVHDVLRIIYIFLFRVVCISFFAFSGLQSHKK